MANKKLKDIEKGMKRLKQLKRDITRNVDRKVTSTVKSVRKEYLKGLDKINGATLEYVEPVEDRNSKIVSYSSFDLDMLGKYIAQIMSLYEGKDYCYHKAPTVVPDVEGEGIVYMVVDEEYKFHFYQYSDSKYILNTMEKIQENGIVFSTYLNEIDFYRINEDAKLVSTVNFDKFPYVQKFIDFIIEYRIDNELEDDLTDEKFEYLTYDFVFDAVEEICARFRIRENEALKYLEEAKRTNKRVEEGIDRILKL